MGVRRVESCQPALNQVRSDFNTPTLLGGNAHKIFTFPFLLGQLKKAQKND